MCGDCGGRDRFATGTAVFNLNNIWRHATKCQSHADAVIRWNERAAADPGRVVSTTVTPADTSFILPRVLVETRGSFRDFGALATNVSAGSAVPTARTRTLNRADAKASVATMASVERDVTHAFLTAATAFALAADGLGRTYQVTSRW